MEPSRRAECAVLEVRRAPEPSGRVQSSLTRRWTLVPRKYSSGTREQSATHSTSQSPTFAVSGREHMHDRCYDNTDRSTCPGTHSTGTFEHSLHNWTSTERQGKVTNHLFHASTNNSRRVLSHTPILIFLRDCSRLAIVGVLYTIIHSMNI